MNDSATGVEILRHWTLMYNILLCFTLAMMVWMAWKLHKAEKAIKALQAGSCRQCVQECPVHNAKPGDLICAPKPGDPDEARFGGA